MDNSLTSNSFTVDCLLSGVSKDMEDLIEKRVEIDEMEDPEAQQSLLGLFQVDLGNYIDIKFGMMYHMTISPEQIDNFPYYEYEMYVEKLADILKKKHQGETNQQSEMKQTQFNPQRAAEGFMKKAQSSVPKLNPSTMKLAR